MKKITLFDAEESEQLLPLTFTKPIGELRMGILTFKERWEKRSQLPVDYCTREYLQVKYPFEPEKNTLWVNPSFFATQDLVEAVLALQINEALVHEEKIIAVNGENLSDYEQTISYQKEVLYIAHSWDLFMYNDQAIRSDFELLTKGRVSQKISETNRVLAPENIFIEEGAKVEFSILNAEHGPIYVGREAEIMEGCMVRGSFALCDHAKLNMGAKIYSGTTVGPHCKVGGEVNNSILMAYSNKGHDGFLGNSVIGEWCNLGADTNNSNLKNNYATVKMWNYQKEQFLDTGLQFCGLIMGDHSKSAINTQFNTGTSVGICANIFHSGFPPTQIPSFTWGGTKDSPVFALEKAYEAADRMMNRRDKQLSDADKIILKHLFMKYLR